MSTISWGEAVVRGSWLCCEIGLRFSGSGVNRGEVSFARRVFCPNFIHFNIDANSNAMARTAVKRKSESKIPANIASLSSSPNFLPQVLRAIPD
jgi:hypothetical protein